MIEDDHAGPITDSYLTVTGGRERWAVVGSVSKFFGPDLRVAVVGGDLANDQPAPGRQLLASGWVSYVIQRTVVALWESGATQRLLAEATGAYTARRQAAIEALAARGITALGRSGLNIWIPVSGEGPALLNMMQLGWAVPAGEIFRLGSPAGLRVTTADLPESEIDGLADDVARALNPTPRTARS